MEATKVAIVIGQLTAGGAEGQVLLLCRGLLRRGTVEPIVYCLSEETRPYGPQITALGVPVRIVSGGRLARVWKLRRCFESDGVAVVHAWLYIANAFAWLATRGTRRPLLTSARNCKRQGRLLDVMNRRAFAASAAIVANSDQVREYIVDVYGAPAARVRVVHNAIDTERFCPAEVPRHDGPCVAMVGRLVPQKNPHLFVAAAAAVRRHVPSARFVLVGDGPLRAELEAAVAEAGLTDACILTGERDDVPDLLRQADLFWLTSEWEGLPNVVLEAMACGLPVIATDVGGIRELVRDGEEGFVIPRGDCDALVRHAVALLTDAERRRRLSRAARERALAFGRDRMVSTMLDLYRRAGNVGTPRAPDPRTTSTV